MTKLQKIGKDELEEKARQARALLSPCVLCPRGCKVDRLKNKKGFCKAGLLPEVASFHAHHGEEPPVSGFKGSGTIFFSHCSLRCVFCQNYPLSQLGEGKEVTVERLAEIMLELQGMGCHNINLVTPTHYAAQILEALVAAKEKGLETPLVYNCGGYEPVDVLRILDGVIDIYMPDLKYGDNESAKKYSGAGDYVEKAKAAHAEMFRQAGSLKVENGIAKNGMLVRHLVMPGGLSSSKKVFEFIANELSPDMPVNIMAQYYPAHLAQNYPEIDRYPAVNEYAEALKMAKDAGLTSGWRQTIRTLAREKIPEWRDDLKDRC